MGPPGARSAAASFYTINLLFLDYEENSFFDGLIMFFKTSHTAINELMKISFRRLCALS